MQRVNATIVGGGDIGCAIAHELSKTLDNVILVEKNPRITQGENQSTRSSGVIHAGIYHDRRVSPLKARLCPYGNELAYEFFDEYDIFHKRTGKLVIARKR